MATSLRQVWQRHALPADAPVLAVGCGRFLLPDLLQTAGLPAARPVDAAMLLGTTDAAQQDWALVALPAVAVAALRAGGQALLPSTDRPTETTEDARCG